MRTICASAFAIGLVTLPSSFAAAAVGSQAMQLTDAQLDKVAAGVFVTAEGDGSANGQLSRSEVTVSVAAQSGGLNGDSALGQVSAIALSSAGPLASASSTLSLSVSYP
jgi:hypothetical protein